MHGCLFQQNTTTCWQKVQLKIWSQQHSSLKVRAEFHSKWSPEQPSPVTDVEARVTVQQDSLMEQAPEDHARRCNASVAIRLATWPWNVRETALGKRCQRWSPPQASKKCGVSYHPCTCWRLTMHGPSQHWVFPNTGEHISMALVEMSGLWSIYADGNILRCYRTNQACSRLHAAFASRALSCHRKAARFWPPTSVWCNQETRKSAPDLVR